MKTVPPDYVLRIELLDVKPVIWRRLVVPGAIKMDRLHTVLRCAMGWDGGHIYDLAFRERNFGPPFDDPMSGQSIDEGKRVKLVTALQGARTFYYLYDISAGWEHRVKVERVLPGAELTLAFCLDGERACPPDDMPDPQGYMDFMQALADPAHADHEEMARRYDGEFDPAAFNADSVNAVLHNIYL